MKPIINPKFQSLLPRLSNDEARQLEESILNEGVRETIKIWKGQIIDGHNRFAVCEKHNIAFETENLDFADDDAAFEWIFINQLGRRNLTEQNKTLFIGQLYELRKKTQGGDRKSSGNSCYLILDEEPPEPGFEIIRQRQAEIAADFSAHLAESRETLLADAEFIQQKQAEMSAEFEREREAQASETTLWLEEMQRKHAEMAQEFSEFLSKRKGE